MAAQKGIFTLWETDGENKSSDAMLPLDEQISNFVNANDDCFDIPNPLFYKIIIGKNDWYLLYRWLKLRRVDAATLFPGYDGIVKAFNEDRVARKILKSHSLDLPGDRANHEVPFKPLSTDNLD